MVDVEMYPLGAGWAQVGWYYGSIGAGCFSGGACIQRHSGTLGNYYEAKDLYGNYYLGDYRGIALNHSSIHRVEYSSAGVWHILVDDTTLVAAIPYMNTSGGPWAGAEIAKCYEFNPAVCPSPGSNVGMPLTIYGYSTASDSRSLQLRGGAGWESWDTSVRAYDTAIFNERPTYYYSWFYQYFKFESHD
ncbi:MAG: hypothetical protein ACXVD8_09030, partial [Actinomycetota bacterium]